jgi:tRNA pseudouridine55 synthase
MHQPEGILLIDKPAGITSFDCIRRLRRQTGTRKFGHAGTLDPMATGLMIILAGRATKLADQLLKQDKTYLATLSLGAVSSTGDAEGEITQQSDYRPPEAGVEAILRQLEGEIMQVPPAYSAIKIGGQPAYKRIRRGEEVVIPARKVRVDSIKLQKYDYPEIHLEVAVSSGTYIRTLAQDIGEKLGTGAYLTALRRTIIGPYRIEEAADLKAITADNLAEHFIKLRQD